MFQSVSKAFMQVLLCDLFFDFPNFCMVIFQDLNFFDEFFFIVSNFIFKLMFLPFLKYFMFMGVLPARVFVYHVHEIPKEAKNP